MRIVNTDNFGGDYPDEKFVTEIPLLSREAAQKICDILNDSVEDNHPRYWAAVENDYKLWPGFEP